MSIVIATGKSAIRRAFQLEGAAAPGTARRRVRVLFSQVGNTGERAALAVVSADFQTKNPATHSVEDFTLPVGRNIAGLSYDHIAEIERANRCLPLEN